MSVKSTMEVWRRASGGLGFALAAIMWACAPTDTDFEAEDIESDGELEPSITAVCAPPVDRSTYALGGSIVTPEGPIDGYVVVEDESIVDVVLTRNEVPVGAQVVETGGTIAPGLIDLHNHVAYNFIHPWTPSKLYRNRNQWQRDSAYAEAVKKPYNAVKNAGHLCQAQKWGELRALMGGTTTIQGSIGRSCQSGWVRNVESYNFCVDTVRQNVLPIDGITQAEADSLISQFEAGTTKSYLVHLAEGVDDLSRRELDKLRSLKLLRKEVVAIHATAMTAEQLAEMGQAGMKLVWSPLSNLALYGATTDIPTALASGIKVALAPDWTPSGSDTLLGELKVADKLNRDRWGSLLSDEQLLAMVTSTPAEIVGFERHLGKIKAGFAADLMVVKSNGHSGARAIIEAKQGDVLLTVIAGKPFYGDANLLSSLGVATFDAIDVCGESRGLVVKDNTVPGGDETLADVSNILAQDASAAAVYPLATCRE